MAAVKSSPPGPTARSPAQTGATIAHDARRMAQALEALGCMPGDRVATLAMNHVHHLTAWYGTIGMGGVLHTINPRLFDDQLDYIANHAEDRVLLYDRAFAGLVERMKPRWPRIEHYVCFDPAPGEEGFVEWLAPHDGDYAWVEGDERDPCGLCYTSGTTGNPKGVLYEHRSTMLHAMAEVAPDVFNLSVRSVALPIVPMFHANAWGLPWAAPLTGCKLVLSADYRPDKMCELFQSREGDPFGGRADRLARNDRPYRADRGRPRIAQDGDDRRIGGTAGDDRMVPQQGHRGRACVGDDRDLTDRHARRSARELGFDERRRANRIHRPPRPCAVWGRASNRR